MVLAAGVSAFHTSAAAGLRWQQLLSLYKPPHTAQVLPYTQEQSPGNVLTGITGGVKLGRGGRARVWCSAKLYFGKVSALPLRPLCCSAMGVIALFVSVAAIPQKSIVSSFLPFCSISLVPLPALLPSFQGTERIRPAGAHLSGACTGTRASVLRSVPGAGKNWWDGDMGWGLLTRRADTHHTGIQALQSHKEPEVSCSLGGAPPSLFPLNLHVLQLPPPPPITHSLQALLSSGLSNCTKKVVFFPHSLFKGIVSVQNNTKQPMLQDRVRQHCTQQRSSCLQHTLTKGQQGQKKQGYVRYSRYFRVQREMPGFPRHSWSLQLPS